MSERDKEAPPAFVQIANWQFVRLLGKGGMSEVYEVENTRLGTRAALKLFTCAKDTSGEIRARFLAEAALLARLRHPRLVRVFDYGIAPEIDRPYFVMDLVLDSAGESKTLADKEFVGADETHVAMWYDDLREALAFIHGRGIIHRDIKLQNVLVGPDGHAILSDFGIAKIFDSSLRKDVGLALEETILASVGRRTVMGSLGYLAPELEIGVVASPASDYYALGVLVFYLLTGTWCEPRTDLAAALDTYNPIWKDILPNLLHVNPVARRCPSWRDLEQKSFESELAQAEQRLEAAQDAVRTARNGKRIAQVVAILLACLTFLLVFSVRHSSTMLETADLCFIPAAIPESDSTDENYDGLTVEDMEEEALPRARGLICNVVAQVNRNELSFSVAANQIREIGKKEEDESVKYLLSFAASNLTERIKK